MCSMLYHARKQYLSLTVTGVLKGGKQSRNPPCIGCSLPGHPLSGVQSYYLISISSSSSPSIFFAPQLFVRKYHPSCPSLDTKTIFQPELRPLEFPARLERTCEPRTRPWRMPARGWRAALLNHNSASDYERDKKKMDFGSKLRTKIGGGESQQKRLISFHLKHHHWRKLD